MSTVPGPGDDERRRDLADLDVGHADHGGVGHVGVFEEHCFELGRCHLEAVVLDQLLDPPDDEQVPVGVDAGEIAGVQPAVGVDGLGGRGGVVEVSGHHLWSPHEQLADLVDTECSAFVVDDERFGVRHGHAAGARFHVGQDRRVAHRAELGHAERLVHRAADAVGDLGGQLRRRAAPRHT